MDKYWRPEVYEMTNHQTGKYTKLVVKDIKFKDIKLLVIDENLMLKCMKGFSRIKPPILSHF